MKKNQRVEYVDVLGRTRSCKKSELEKLQKIDEKLKPNQVIIVFFLINTELLFFQCSTFRQKEDLG